MNINTIFLKLCEKLNLSSTLYQKLTERYEAVSLYLTNRLHKEGIKSVAIYPQGSVAIGTTVKPIGCEEYDLDFVCETNMPPFELFSLIKQLLQSNGIYNNLVEEKKRCVRINYKGDFHLDILPACHDANTSTGILIPDRELKHTLPSDPKGYANWFKEKSILSSGYKLDEGIEVLPCYQHPTQKSTLQCIVQLMKRNRDIFFEQKSDQSPPSIIITTLCGKYYKKRHTILDDMIHIIESIQRDRVEVVYNPINPQELLSEKWKKTPLLYQSFNKWINSLHIDLKLLKDEKNTEEKCINMFGEKIVKPILDELGKRNFIHQNRTNLSVSSSGILSTRETHIPVHKNTFYGDIHSDE